MILQTDFRHVFADTVGLVLLSRPMLHTVSKCSILLLSTNRPLLPEYQLHFGSVMSGTSAQLIVTATNTCCFPVSFTIDQSAAHSCGFAALFSSVTDLPPGDSFEIPVTFDPPCVDSESRTVEALMSLNVSQSFSCFIANSSPGAFIVFM